MSARATQDAALTSHIQTIFYDGRRAYGSPRVHASLRAQGVTCSKKRVARFMRANALVARGKRRYVGTTDSRHTELVAAHELARNVQTSTPNRVWVADITYVPTREGWFYLAVVLDLYARRVVGWSMDRTLDRRQPRVGLLHHSDRGSQYARGDDQTLRAKAGITPRMSRKGNCWDNAVMERFFASLKAEIGVKVCNSHAQARSGVFEYIERCSNRQRHHATLAYRTPVEHEQRWFDQQEAA